MNGNGAVPASGSRGGFSPEPSGVREALTVDGRAADLGPRR